MGFAFGVSFQVFHTQFRGEKHIISQPYAYEGGNPVKLVKIQFKVTGANISGFPSIKYIGKFCISGKRYPIFRIKNFRGSPSKARILTFSVSITSQLCSG